MSIDIDALSEQELRDLHHRITERIHRIHELKTTYAMLHIAPGDRVAFDNEGRQIEGVVQRLNRKTVSICAGKDGHWKVSATLLRKVTMQPSGGADGSSCCGHGDAGDGGAQASGVASRRGPSPAALFQSAGLLGERAG